MAAMLEELKQNDNSYCILSVPFNMATDLCHVKSQEIDCKLRIQIIHNKLQHVKTLQSTHLQTQRVQNHVPSLLTNCDFCLELVSLKLFN